MQAAAAQDWTDLTELFNMEAAAHHARALNIRPHHVAGKAAMAEARGGGPSAPAPASAAHGDTAAPARPSGAGDSAENPVVLDLD